MLPARSSILFLSTTYSRTISLDWGIPSWPACRRNERKVMGPLCVTLEGFGCKCEDDIWITWKWYLPWNYFGVTCKNIRTTIPHTNYWHRCMLRRLSVLFTNSTHSLTGFHTEQLVAIRDCPSWDPLKSDYRAVLVYSYRFHGTFTMGTGGHYITMLSADWSISTSHDPLSSSYHSEKMLWNPSI